MKRFPPLSSGTQIGLVGIVASTGGLDAVEQVLGRLPADFPVPVLVL
jgi:chemotaxis response regulator CheB